MNKYQDHNLESQKLWEKDYYKMPFKDIFQERNWMELGHDNNMFNRFICVKCGGKITMGIIQHFNYDVTKIICVECRYPDNNFYTFKKKGGEKNESDR